MPWKETGKCVQGFKDAQLYWWIKGSYVNDNVKWKKAKKTPKCLAYGSEICY